MRQKRQRDSQAGRQRELLLCCGSPTPHPHLPAHTSGTPGPSGALRRLGDPLLACHHYSAALCNICLHSSLPFPSSLISLTPPSSSFGFLSPRCPATAARAHHHSGASCGRNAQEMNESSSPRWPTLSLLRTWDCHKRCTLLHTGLAPLRPPSSPDP